MWLAVLHTPQICTRHLRSQILDVYQYGSRACLRQRYSKSPFSPKLRSSWAYHFLQSPQRDRDLFLLAPQSAPSMVQSAEHRDCAVSDRGGIVENTHRVHVVVTDASGKLLFAVGNSSRMTLARSAAKPIQILALLDTKGFDKFGFTDADVALMCSSHSSEEVHIRRGREMLVKIAAREEDLRCGGHLALSDAVNEDWIRRDFVPGALCNNCSAKHIGILAGAKAIGLGDIENYHDENHLIQLCVKAVFEEMTSLSSEELKWWIDGCNLPAPALPLSDLGRLYAILAEATDTSKSTYSQAPPERRSWRVSTTLCGNTQRWLLDKDDSAHSSCSSIREPLLESSVQTAAMAWQSGSLSRLEGLGPAEAWGSLLRWRTVIVRFCMPW